HELGAVADLQTIAKRAALAGDGAAVHADVKTVRAAGRLRGAVEEIPDFQAALIVPLDPLAVDRVVPGLPRGNRVSCRGLEFAFAVVAIADAVAPHAAPMVVGEALRVAALDDLLDHGRNVLVVVGAVDAGDVLVRGPVGVAGGLAGEPVRVSAVEFGR